MDERFFLYVIEDGEWHRLEDVAEELGISHSRVQGAAEYLAGGGLIQYDEEKGEVRVKDWVKRLPGAEWQEPGKRSFGAVTIPREGDVKVQDTTISNNLDLDIEVAFVIAGEKLKEISISKVEEAKSE